MSKIFLSGGGDEVSTYQYHKQFIETCGGKDARILYIPIALDSAKHSWADCYKWISNALKDFTTNIDMITSLESLNLEFLRNYSGIYVGGGNTYKLLKTFRETGFDKLLEKYIKQDGNYFGGSAGAIIMGQTISISQDPNEVNLQDLTGLQLVNFNIYPHYNGISKRKFKNTKYLKEDECEIIQIN